MSMPTQPVRYMGGQAVMDGVMMRGEDIWAVAVRRPDGGIELRTGECANWSQAWGRIPLVRGVANLIESLSLGMRALTWSSEVNTPEEDRLSKGGTAVTMIISLVFFVGMFLLIPLLGARGITSLFGLSPLAFHIIEGLLNLGFFMGYLVVIGKVPDINRVFQYHGAEHKAIAAYENDVPLTAEEAQKFTTQHVRCGTNFLLTVFVIAIFIYSLVGGRSVLVLVASRVVLIPVIAGLAYEVIRFAARNMGRRWVRMLMIPGLTLQRLTTREPSIEQVEVAIAALAAVFTPAQTDEVESRVSA